MIISLVCSPAIQTLKWFSMPTGSHSTNSSAISSLGNDAFPLPKSVVPSPLGRFNQQGTMAGESQWLFRVRLQIQKTKQVVLQKQAVAEHSGIHVVTAAWSDTWLQSQVPFAPLRGVLPAPGWRVHCQRACPCPGHAVETCAPVAQAVC